MTNATRVSGLRITVTNMVDANRIRAVRELEQLIEEARRSGDTARLERLEMTAATHGLLSSLGAECRNTLILARSSATAPKLHARPKEDPQELAALGSLVLATSEAVASLKQLISKEPCPMALDNSLPTDAVTLVKLLQHKIALARDLAELAKNPVLIPSQKRQFDADVASLMREIATIQEQLEAAIVIEEREAKKREADSRNPPNPGPTWKGLPNDNPFGEVLSGDQARALAKLDRQFGLGEPEPLVSFKDGVHALTSLPTPEQARQHAETLRRAGVR